MALVIVDTDVLIDHLRGFGPSVGQVTSLSEAGRLRTTTISLFELLTGAGEGPRGDAVRQLVEDLEAFELDRKSSTIAAEIRRELDAAGQAIGTADCLIAGICLAHNVPLLTRNRRHFSRVPNLELFEGNHA